MDELTREFLAESKEGLDRMERCLTDLEARPGDGELVAEMFRAVHTIKGGTGFLGFERLQALAHAGENLLGTLRSGLIPVTPDLINELLALHDGLSSVLRLIETTGAEGRRSTDDDYDLIARMLALTAGASPSYSTQLTAPEPHGGHILPVEHNSPEQQLYAANEAERRVVAQTAEMTLRVEIDVLNRLMNLVGELVLTRNGILQSLAAAPQFSDLGRRLDAVTSDLRGVVMQARMQPVSHLFGKFPRMVRDLARVCGRNVRLEFEGEGTELDKTLLEAVRDPLTHAVRNAVDHGIEAPEDRIRAGKAPQGVVRLRAYSQNGGVVIEVADDGAGISVQRVLSRAVDRGLVSAERAAEMSSADALRLLFEPGFSTAATVTSISGRGVGLDVVRSNVEKVGGRVEIDSCPGVGTALRLRMPLTLAIVPALIVRSSGQSFAVPQSRMVELAYFTPDELSQCVERIGSAMLLRIRNQLIPFISLSDTLELKTTATPSGKGSNFVIVEGDGRQYALVVDELLSPEEIVVKPLSPLLRLSGVFTAAGMLGSGELALILDIGGIGERAAVAVRVTPGSLMKPHQHAIPPGSAATQQFILYLIANGVEKQPPFERAAIPLAFVERIETVPRRCVQWTADRILLPYGEELLPLEDDGHLLASPSQDELAILVCSAPQRFGIVVSQVVDLCNVPALPGGGFESVVLIDGQVTRIRIPVTLAEPPFEEVA